MEGKSRATWCLLLSLVLLSLVCSHARAQSDHRLRWRTLETPHFRLHYHEPLGVLARTLAAEAEAINARIERALGLTLAQNVELVLADDDDTANGFATPLPSNSIRLRAAAPDDMSALADYDHWPTTLLTHEHTHILHLEHASGIPMLIQRLFGRTYSPQSYLPGWVIEGLAVVEESSHTSGGRAHSAMFEMMLRMDALEGRVLPLSWLGFEGEPWPHGNARYLYGQGLMQFIYERHGEAALGAFVREYGRRVVPYGLNRALKRATGETFVDAYTGFVAELRERSKATLAGVTATGMVEGRRLTFHGETTRSPRFVTNDELAYAMYDARHPSEVRRISVRGGVDAARIVRTGSVAQLAPVPGQGRLLFSADAFHRGVYSYQELSSVDLDGTHARQLTKGLRAREPDVSPDGKTVAFVTHAAGTSQLELADITDIARSRRVVVASRRLGQVFTPRWSPDGRTIAYGAYEQGGFRDVWLLDLASGARIRVTYDRAIDRGPVFARDGKTLYFSSDRSGIANLYAYALQSGALTQVTNVIGGAFQPDISPDGSTLVYVGYTSRGYDLYALDLEQLTPRPAGPAPPRDEPRPPPAPIALPSRSYASLEALWPRYYQLAVEDGGTGNRAILRTTGSDPVGLHSWNLELASGLSQHDLSAEAGYAYRQARLPVLLYGALRERDRGDLRVRGGRPKTWRAREGSVGLGSQLVLPTPLHTVRMRVDHVLRFLQKAEPIDFEFDPNYAPPRLPPLGFDATTYWSASYSSTQRQPYDISKSWGQLLSISGTLSEPYLGSRERGYGLSWRAEQFVRFGFRESVLALAYTGGHHTSVGLGGYPAQLVPLRDVLLGSAVDVTDYARLRGLPMRYGSELEIVQLEYRVLVSRINRGIDTLPIFARRVHAAVFVDAGDAWDGRFRWRRIGVGMGAELRFDWATEYSRNFMLRVGLAHGVTAGRELQWYTSLAMPF